MPSKPKYFILIKIQNSVLQQTSFNEKFNKFGFLLINKIIINYARVINKSPDVIYVTYIMVICIVSCKTDA